MRYLIDTNILGKYITGDYISRDIEAILDDYENQIYISSESMKELIYLMKNKKITPLREYRSKTAFDIVENVLKVQIKYITKQHLQTFAELIPAIGHKDPSDHVIISQAISERLPLISSDLKFPKYENQGLILIMNK